MKLKSVNFYDSSQLEIIEKNAFSYSSLNFLSIPSNVSQIGIYSFYKCKNLETVEFPDDSKLTTISVNLFNNSSIKKIHFPPSVSTIKDGSFSYCDNLSVVEFHPDSKLDIICENAFANTPQLEIFPIPKNYNKFSAGIFDHNKDLKGFDIHPENKNYLFLNNQILLFKNNENYDTILYSRKDIEEIEIPSTIKIISDHAFTKCTSLKKVTFEENSQLSVIMQDAFFQCGFESILIPLSVEKIDKRCFAFCESLKSIEFDKNSKITSFGSYILTRTKIEEIKIPASIKKIEEGAFDDMTFLKSIEFDENSELDLIGCNVFFGSSLENLSMPLSVKQINGCSFNKANKLINIFISNENKSFLYYENKILLYKSNENENFEEIIFARKDLQEITIPSFIKNFILFFS